MDEAPELLAQNLNCWFTKEPAQRMLRTLDGTARAYLSNRYRRIDNLLYAVPGNAVGGSFMQKLPAGRLGNRMAGSFVLHVLTVRAAVHHASRVDSRSCSITSSAVMPPSAVYHTAGWAR